MDDSGVIDILREEIYRLKNEQLSDNNTIWKLQLENRELREGLSRYGRHLFLDCVKDDNLESCHCNLIDLYKYLGII